MTKVFSTCFEFDFQNKAIVDTIILYMEKPKVFIDAFTAFNEL